MAILELDRPFDHGMMDRKFRDDISNGSGVIVWTDKQIRTRTLLKTYHPRCAGGINICQQHSEK